MRPQTALGSWWALLTVGLLAGFFIQAVLAGAMLSGVGWARTAHSAMAAVLIASTAAAGVAVVVNRRQIPHGPKLGMTLLVLAAVVLLQAAIGALSAKGVNLLWLHIPLGVALLGLATYAAVRVR